MSISSTSSTSNILRFSGMATGLDTDTIIKELMNAERIPLVKLQKKRQITEWKKELYREITNSLRSLKDEFFNVLKPSTNLMSTSSFKKFTVTSSNSDIVTATGSASAVTGTHTIDSITSLAKQANVSSSGAISKELVATGAATLDYTNANQFKVTLDGVTKTITLRDGAYASTNDLITNGTDGLKKLLDNAFGSGKISVSESSGVLKLSAGTSAVTVGSGTEDALAGLKFTSGASNRINLNSTLESISLKTPMTFDVADNVSFKINGKEFTFAKTTTMSDVFNQINNSSAGVTIGYNQLTDVITVKAKETGAGDKIVIENTAGNFFGGATGIAAGTYNNGTDAVFSLDGVAGVTRSTNTFSIDGVSYTLKQTSATPVTVNLTADIDSTFETIKSFVTKYNEVIEKINTKTTEKRYRTYEPLTTEQKEEMSESEIETWEAKAKSGLLRSDSTLESITNDMRRALSDIITGVDGSLRDIGITTGLYSERGKLTIDEEKLKKALQETPDKVMSMFTKSSSIAYSPDLTADQRTQRYEESGFAQRISDILQDSIRTTRDKNGYKGTLLEKAGIEGDTTEFLNMLDDDLKEQDERISLLEDKLYKKETMYYNKFTALERAVAQLNNQANWFTQQTSG